MSDALLAIDKLSTHSTNSINLNNIDFKLEQSEVHALIGERGVGKGLFVNVLLGTEKAFDGTIRFLDSDISSKVGDISKTKINFLIKDPMLAEGLTIHENFFLIKRNKQNMFQIIHHRKLKKQITEIFKQLKIDFGNKQYVHQLTAEEKKELEIAKLYYYNPDIVVMFEPTENLTKKSRQLFFRLVNKLKKNGTGIIYVTNKWEEALKIADNISVIYEGELIGKMIASDAKKEPVKLLKLLSGLKTTEGFGQDSEILHKETEEVIDAIFKATEFLTSNYELNDVLNMLGKYACRIMNSDGCNIYLTDEKTKTIMDIISFSKFDETKTELKTEIVMDIMESKTYYYRNSEEESFGALFKTVKNVKAILCYPIIIRSRNTALLEVFYQARCTQTNKQLRYLKTLSKQAAIAIDNTRLLGKSALLQETHHRIKNNLQTITSIIKMQKNNYHKTKTQNVDVVIDDIISRIKSIAAIHDLLSKDVEGRSIVNMKEVINSLLAFYIIEDKPGVSFDLDDIFIPYNKTTSVSLIINELLNNCINHAFIDKNDGIIRITCKELKDSFLISIHDNGIGLPGGFSIEKLNSLGLFIVNSIVKYDFNGSFDVFNEDGTHAIIKIPKEKLLLSKA